MTHAHTQLMTGIILLKPDGADGEVLLNVLRCQLTNAEARFSKSLRPRKPEGSLGRTAQDGHLDSHTAPELSDGAEGKNEVL